MQQGIRVVDLPAGLPVLVASYNEYRKSLTLRNPSAANTIYFSNVSNVSATAPNIGMMLGTGQPYYDEYWIDEVWAFAAVATTIEVVEAIQRNRRVDLTEEKV